MPGSPFKHSCIVAACSREPHAGGRGRCDVHAQAVEQTRSLASDRVHSALYDSARWKALRKALLQAHPLCACPECLTLGRTRATAVVHHRRAHGGDEALFFDVTNLQPMAKRCHDALTARGQRRADRGGKRAATSAPLPPRLRVVRETPDFTRGVARG